MAEPLSTTEYSDLESLPMAAQLRTVTSRLWRQMRRDVTSLNPNITPTRTGVLSVLDRLGSMTIGELAAAEHMHPSTMTRVVDWLEKQQLVARAIAERDKREIRVSITKSGRSVVRTNREYEDELMTKALDRFTPQERERLALALPLLARLSDDAWRGGVDGSGV